MLAACMRKLITARARKNKRTARMLANARKDLSILLEMLWEHEPQASVSTAFSSSLKLSRVFLKSLEIRGTCLLFLLENTATKKAKRLVSFGYQKCKFSFLAPSLRQRPVLWAWLKMFFSPKRY